MRSWLSQLNKWSAVVFPLRLFYGKEEAFWTLASTLAIATVKSSARIGLELFSDHSAQISKTWEDHDVRDLTLDLWIQQRLRVKTSLALWPLSPRGYSPQTPHVRSGAASRLAMRTRRKCETFHTPLCKHGRTLASVHQKTQASRRICIGKGAGQPPASVARPKDGATLRLR